MNGMWMAALGLVGGFLTAVGGYFTARRTSRGTIGTSEAATLWIQSNEQLARYRNELVELRAEQAAAREELAVLRLATEKLRDEAVKWRLEAVADREEAVRLREETQALRLEAAYWKKQADRALGTTAPLVEEIPRQPDEV